MKGLGGSLPRSLGSRVFLTLDASVVLLSLNTSRRGYHTLPYNSRSGVALRDSFPADPVVATMIIAATAAAYSPPWYHPPLDFAMLSIFSEHDPGHATMISQSTGSKDLAPSATEGGGLG